MADIGTGYYQQFVDGVAHSGAYLATGRNCVLLGVTRQLVGCGWLGASGFIYCGSVGPMVPCAKLLDQWRQIGGCLVDRFGLRGLFGVDAMVAENRVWPVEVNPRYTASMEVVERRLASSMVALHAEACQRHTLPTTDQSGSDRGRCAGKAILFADRDSTVSERFLDQISQWNDGKTWPTVADIPSSPETIPVGRPVLTIFADGRDSREVERKLKMRANQVRSLLR